MAASGTGVARAACLLSALLPSKAGIRVQPALRPLLLQQMNQQFLNPYGQTDSSPYLNVPNKLCKCQDWISELSVAKCFHIGSLNIAQPIEHCQSLDMCAGVPCSFTGCSVTSCSWMLWEIPSHMSLNDKLDFSWVGLSWWGWILIPFLTFNNIFITGIINGML